MKPHETSSCHYHQVLSRLTLLPRKIIALSDAEHMSEFILHELSHISCFNLEKAAYFVDNPDFDCFRGVAGYDQCEYEVQEDIALPHTFYRHLGDCNFNKQVRAVGNGSYRKEQRPEEAILKALTSELVFKEPQCYVWPLKHDNYGVLVYELKESSCGNGHAAELKEHIENGLHLLGFCPLFLS